MKKVASEILKEEGLFITEFSDSFFENYIKQDIRLEKIIQDIADKTLRLQEETKENIWHCILYTTLNEICPQGLEVYFDFDKYNAYPQFYNILSGFYKEPFFLKIDVAQAILYNLYRCNEGEDTYDLNENYGCSVEGDLDKLINEYKELFSYGRGKKEHFVDLVPGLELLRRNSEKHKNKTKVCFLQLTEDRKLILDRSYAKLNILFVGNDKFQNYLYHIKSKENYQNILKNIKNLNKDTKCKPLHYVWEKMTDFNTINIVAKFFVELIGRDNITKKELKVYEEKIAYFYSILFKRIGDMPNILTRLLILKQAFSYIKENPKSKNNIDISPMLLDELTRFLARINGRYKYIQDTVLEVAVLVRWKIEKDETLDIQRWIRELETEYSSDLFETLLVSLNLDENLYKYKNGNIQKYTYNEIEEADTEKNKCLTIERRSGRIDDFGYLKRCDLLKVIKDYKYTTDKAELARCLKEQGWGVAERYYTFLGQISPNIYEDTFMGRICTKTYSEQEKEALPKQYEEETRFIEETIRPYLLSEYKNIIYESLDMDKYDEYIDVFNFLLYHFFI